jgi:hypothetical protein
MDLKRYIISAIATLCLGLNLVWCGAAVSAESGAEKGISLYRDLKIVPLKPEECGQCHTPIYNLLKSDGGKHRINCQQCHVQFHIYRPGKTPYKEILPRCDSCHQQPHGPDLTQCTTCHQQPHTPLAIPADRRLDQGCSVCHPEEDRDMNTYRTWHTELYCSTCHHTKHGYIPKCLECHQRHTDKVDIFLDACLTCHPPHKARQVVYPEDIPKEACAVCHRSQYELLQWSQTKHSALSCTKCHPDKHRTIMRCTQCHDKPHSADILKNFTLCGQCHGPAHGKVQ